MMERQQDRSAIKQANKGGKRFAISQSFFFFFPYILLPHSSYPKGLAENQRGWQHEQPLKEPGLVLIIVMLGFFHQCYSTDFHCSDTAVKQA